MVTSKPAARVNGRRLQTVFFPTHAKLVTYSSQFLWRHQNGMWKIQLSDWSICTTWYQYSILIGQSVYRPLLLLLRVWLRKHRKDKVNNLNFYKLKTLYCLKSRIDISRDALVLSKGKIRVENPVNMAIQPDLYFL